MTKFAIIRVPLRAGSSYIALRLRKTRDPWREIATRRDCLALNSVFRRAEVNITRLRVICNEGLKLRCYG